MKTRRENILLVHRATTLINGANVHKGTAVLRAYQNAIDLASDLRCRNKRWAKRLVDTTEADLRKFCGWDVSNA